MTREYHTNKLKKKRLENYGAVIESSTNALDFDHISQLS